MGLTNLYRIKQLYDWFDKRKLDSVPWWIEFYKRTGRVKEIREMLSGYKTYLSAALMAAVTFAHMMGYVNDTLYEQLLALLGAGAFASVRSALKNLK